MSVLSALITREEMRNRNMIAEYTREEARKRDGRSVISGGMNYE